MHLRWGASAIACALVVVTTSTEARADWDLQFATMMGGGWLRETPDLDADKISLSSRSIGSGTIRTGGRGIAMFGLGGDAELIVDDRWKVPLGGVNGWWAFGHYDSTYSSFDGSIVRLRPWTASRIDMLMPGFGRRWKLRRNMVSVAVRTGVSRLGMDGTVAAGSEASDLNLVHWTFLAQAEIEGCRRLDPETRLCIQVVPRIYEHSFMNGVTIGLRMEWGR